MSHLQYAATRLESHRNNLDKSPHQTCSPPMSYRLLQAHHKATEQSIWSLQLGLKVSANAECALSLWHASARCSTCGTCEDIWQVYLVVAWVCALPCLNAFCPPEVQIYACEGLITQTHSWIMLQLCFHSVPASLCLCCNPVRCRLDLV